MKEHQIRPGILTIVLCIVSIISTARLSAQSLDEVLGVRAGTTTDGRISQVKIDELTDDTRSLLSQYKQVMKVVDGLKVYNQQQRRLIRSQEEELAELESSIDNVTVIERQIGPLIERMIDNLAKFVSMDVPFLLSERTERVDFLKETLEMLMVSPHWSCYRFQTITIFRLMFLALR